MSELLLNIEPHVEALGSLLDRAQAQRVLDALASVTGAALELVDESGGVLLCTSPPLLADAGDRQAGQDLRPGAAAARSQPPPAAADTPAVAVFDPASGERLGQLLVHAHRNLSPRELELVQAFAAGIGAAAAQEREARQRAAELTTIYNTSMMLAEARDVNSLLARTVRLISEVMQVKGASIRLIDQEHDELRFIAVHGLSDEYLKSAPLRLSRAAIDHAAIEKGHEQVLDLRGDPRVQFPEVLRAEGIVSLLSVPLRYKQKAIGVLRAYTSEPRRFDQAEIDLMCAVASQAAAAIANARLAEESAQAEALEKQVHLAADVQQRMIPAHAPACRRLELASIYVPCLELAGDLFDFISHDEDRLSVVIADVAGKGVPASLIMATVRAYLRAGAQQGQSAPELIGRLNEMLCHDSRPGEFVSLFYGTFNGAESRLDYVLAGHAPPLLLRDAQVSSLGPGGDTVLGIIPDATFTCHRLDLAPGDRLLLYTDGLDEARNFRNELYGRARVVQSFAQPASSAEQIVQNVIWDMRRFVGMQQRTDDVTVIAVRVLD